MHIGPIGDILAISVWFKIAKKNQIKKSGNKIKKKKKQKKRRKIQVFCIF